jgi:uncharacterized membrane protein YebE (DUF533 family)
MTDHMSKPLPELAKEITADGVVDAAEVKKIRERVFADGKIDREEADFLFSINNKVSGQKNDPGWKALFIEALSKHVLEDEKSPGEIDDDEASYLVSKIQADGVVDDVELSLLAEIMAKAKKTPEKLQYFVLDAMKKSILEDGKIDAQEVTLIKKVIYGTGSGAGAGVDRAEADFLFELNDTVSGKHNDPSWQALFVDAISKHLLEDEKSPGAIDKDEAEWLLSKVIADGQVDEIEKALLKNLKAKAKSYPDSLKFKFDLWKI